MIGTQEQDDCLNRVIGSRRYFVPPKGLQLSAMFLLALTACGGGGLNYGWNIMEGTLCHPADPCNRRGLALPVLDCDHGGNGGVYRVVRN